MLRMIYLMRPTIVALAPGILGGLAMTTSQDGRF